jgi:hypothetical protein
MVDVSDRATVEEVPMPVKVLIRKQLTAKPRTRTKRIPLPKNRLTIRDLGWTRERAREVRAKLGTFAADWDDPSMDIYNEP